MSYKIIDIEGVGSVYGEKLVAAGIVTVDQLLEKERPPQAARLLKSPPAFPANSSLRGSTMPTSSV